MRLEQRSASRNMRVHLRIGILQTRWLDTSDDERVSGSAPVTVNRKQQNSDYRRRKRRNYRRHVPLCVHNKIISKSIRGMANLLVQQLHRRNICRHLLRLRLATCWRVLRVPLCGSGSAGYDLRMRARNLSLRSSVCCLCRWKHTNLCQLSAWRRI